MSEHVGKGIRKSNGERLVERLRAMIPSLPEDVRVENTNASRSARANGAWSWRLVRSDGSPFLPAGLMVGSQISVAELVKSPRLGASRSSLVSNDVDIDHWAPPSHYHDNIFEEPAR